MGHIAKLRNWITELLFPFEYCESISSNIGPEKDSGPQFLKSRHNKIFSLETQSLKNVFNNILFSQLKYSFFSPLMFAETVNITCHKKSMLDYSVKHYIKKLDLFEPGYHYCYEILSFQGEVARINLFVLSATDSEKIISHVPHRSKPVSCLVPLEFILIKLLANYSLK